eukprot:scaffold2281_cov215-Alexandrium_tamarense.AAC.3
MLLVSLLGSGFVPLRQHHCRRRNTLRSIKVVIVVWGLQARRDVFLLDLERVGIKRWRRCMRRKTAD